MLQIHVVSYTVAMEVQIVQSLLLLTTLDKCRRLLSIRKTKNLKYKEVVLSEQQKTMLTTKKTGYHADCYRKFIALGRNAPPKNDDVESKSVHARSSTVAIVSLSTGIMPKICIFCTKKDKKHNGSKQKLVSVETGYFEERSRNVQQPYGIKHYYPNCEALILSPKKYAIMGYAERSIRQLQSKFQKQAKIKMQQSVQSIFGTVDERFILKFSNQYACWWRIRSLQVAMCWV